MSASRAQEGQERADRLVIVDGSNVAHSTERGRALLENIKLIVAKLREEGYDPIIFADAALRHQIDDERGFERMVESGEIRQAPAGTDADYFILTFAREMQADVVSNDRFKDRIQAFPKARGHIIRYMIVNGEVVLERRTTRR
jgi:hypothetical protein